MRKFIYLVILLGICGTSCTSHKEIQKATSFKIGNSVCQKWIGGRESSGSGLDILFSTTLSEASTIVLKEVFFRNKQVPAGLFYEAGVYYIRAEIPSTAANSKEAINFELKASEAIVSFTENNVLKYIKVVGIKEKEPLIYNSRP
ncbi:hypothetical protein [Maribacter sp. LLG6340-A2]|uniref:hypothetical protein n=1 Tax=Maribacter sp. LLG6340-A2 TaxID=3160834 RepID=UPI00386C262A